MCFGALVYEAEPETNCQGDHEKRNMCFHLNESESATIDLCGIFCLEDGEDN